ncbi:MAG: hypothetical protein RLZ63_930 [Pseudomonadota bacterium]
MTRKNRMSLTAVALAIALGASALSAPGWAQQAPDSSFADMMAKVTLVPPGKPDSELLAKVGESVGYLTRMELTQARKTINEALQLDPRSSQLHFLNGFIYHLQARSGDAQKAELALEGYQQALRIDPSNWIAREFLGLAYMDLQQFEPARQAFVEALLMSPDSAPSLYGLMVSSYLSGDARTACTAADQYLRAAPAPQRGFVRSSVSVYAACGNFEQAAQMRDTLAREFGDSGTEVQRVDQRLNQWKAVYRQQAQEPQPTMQLAQAFTLPTPPAPLEPPRDSAPEPVTAGDTAPASPPAAAPAPRLEGSGEGDGPRMALIDVVLLSTQELMSTSKGVNLLGALTLQLGSVSGNLPAYSRNTSASVLNGVAVNVQTTITRAVTVPALSYSLSIANANSAVNEVLARPTLAAIDGMPSEFFSGTNLSAGVVSTSTQGGTTIVPLDKRFGIKLAVTPKFLPGGRVQLKVEAQRTSLNASSDNARVAYQIEIGETTANANVVMNLGDTLMLSGLSEKSASSSRDGVPGLQDVPLVQYLFSHKKTDDIQRSVLILVTPRAPVQVAEAGPGDSMANRMKALHDKFGLPASIPANAEAVLRQLQGNAFFREFRQGDVSLERWDRMRTTADRLKEALGFLYY